MYMTLDIFFRDTRTVVDPCERLQFSGAPNIFHKSKRDKMIRELRIIDHECSKANTCTVLRRDFTMFGNDFTKDSSPFIRDVGKTAVKQKCNDITLVAVIKS